MSKRIECIQNDPSTTSSFGTRWRREQYKLSWDWNIKSLEIPAIVTEIPETITGDEARQYLDVTFSIVNDPTSEKVYRAFPGAGSKKNYLDVGYRWLGATTTPLDPGFTTNPIVINGENVTVQRGDVVNAPDAVIGIRQRFYFSGGTWQEYSDRFDDASIFTVEPEQGRNYVYNAPRGSTIQIRVDPHYANFYGVAIVRGYMFGGLRATSGSYVGYITSTLELAYDPSFNPNEALDDYLTYGDIVIPETTRNTYVFTANGLVAGTPYVFTDTGLVQATTPIIFT